MGKYSMTSIIVPTYNQEEHTIKCFESILKHTNSDDYRLIWADDGSTQESFEMVYGTFQKFKHRRITKSYENVGFIKNVNSAIRLNILFDKPDSIVLLNNDTEVTPNWLPQLTQALEIFDIIGAVTTPKTQWQSYHNLFKLIGVTAPAFMATKEEAQKAICTYIKNKYHSVSGVSFFCAAFRTKIFNEIGFLSEDYGVGYGEDNDFCKRVIDKGKAIAIALGCFIYHHHHGTFDSVYDSETISKIKEKNMATFKNKHNIPDNYVEYK